MPDIFTSEKEAHTSDKEAPIVEKEDSAEKKLVTSSRPATRRHSKEHITHTQHMNPLAAFALDPADVTFANQGQDERIHLFLRKHFITNLPWIIFSGLLFILPPIIIPFFGDVLPFASFLSGNVVFILVLFYYVVVFGGILLTSFINWYFNVYIVTNERVVDVDFVNILYKEVSATRLNLIQDVTTKTGGLFGAVFDYGDVFVQTAGTEVNFDFHAVPRPQQVAREIEKLMENARKKEGISDIEEAMKR